MTRPVPKPGPKPGPRPGSVARPAAAAGAAGAAGSTGPVAPAAAVRPSDPTRFGRIDDDGVVWVTTADGERRVG